MTNQNATVQVKVNEGNLVRNLGVVYSNANVVLGELMQNARRAGATKIAFNHSETVGSLQVFDDGCGISDFQKLLTVAESGWEQGVVDAEKPYGMGWMSTCFAAERVVVESKGKRIRFKSEEALSMQAIEVETSEVTEQTVITLLGLKITNVASSLSQLSEGFPIPVAYNGKELPRPYALNAGMQFGHTEIGHVAVAGMTGYDVRPTTGCMLFLQGLPLNSSRHHAERGDNIVHLDSRFFSARMPDRDQLINTAREEERIENAIKAHVRGMLDRVKPLLTPAEFLDQWYALIRAWRLHEVLNDVPLLPAGTVWVFEQYPVRAGYESCQAQYKGREVTRELVETGAVRLYSCEDMNDANSFACMYAWARGLLLVNVGAFDADHWVQAHVTDLDELEFDLQAVGEGQSAKFDVGDADTLLTCERYVISCSDGSETFEDQAVFHPNGTLYVPAGCQSGEVVRQADSFCDEYDAWREEWYDSAYEKLETLLPTLRGEDPEKTMQRLLRDGRFGDYRNILGQSFVVAVSKKGTIKVTLANQAS